MARNKLDRTQDGREKKKRLAGFIFVCQIPTLVTNFQVPFEVSSNLQNVDSTERDLEETQAEFIRNLPSEVAHTFMLCPGHWHLTMSL